MWISVRFTKTAGLFFPQKWPLISLHPPVLSRQLLFSRKCEDYEAVIRNQNREMEKLRSEHDSLSFTRKGITCQWTQVLEDMDREHEKEVRKLKKVITELLDMVASLTNQNRALEEKRKKLLHDYYETASKLEAAQGLIVKLKAQVNHNYENSSLPSSKFIDRKKITNNRERTSRRPGAQPGHKHHPRRKLTPARTVEIPPDELSAYQIYETLQIKQDSKRKNNSEKS